MWEPLAKISLTKAKQETLFENADLFKPNLLMRKGQFEQIPCLKTFLKKRF